MGSTLVQCTWPKAWRLTILLQSCIDVLCSYGMLGLAFMLKAQVSSGFVLYVNSEFSVRYDASQKEVFSVCCRES